MIPHDKPILFERPILFATEMVDQIESDAKTATRRLLRKQPMTDVDSFGFTGVVVKSGKGEWHARKDGEPAYFFAVSDGFTAEVECPYGYDGDRLWVRESCWILGWWKRDGKTQTGRDRWRFVIDPSKQVRFDDPPNEERCTRAGPNRRLGGWCRRPSIHMPRWASRLLLEVTGIRIERLQAITESDALAEGVSEVPFYPDDGFPPCIGFMLGKNDGKSVLYPTPIEALKAGWEAMHGYDSWAVDWVWVVEFKRVK